MAERGIIIKQPFWTQGGQLHTRYLHGSELRKYLLFWDKIDYPIRSLLEKTENNPDLAFLESASVLVRTKSEGGPVNVKSKRVGGKVQSVEPLHASISSRAQLDAYEFHSARAPGQWSLAHQQIEPSYLESAQGLGVEFELFNMLPIPHREVPLSDILEFKEQRYAELLALRGYIDELYREIISSADIPRARIAAIDKLEKALRDLDSSLRESSIKTIYTSLRSHISGEFYGLLGVGFGGAGLASEFGMSPLLAGLSSAGLALTLRKTVIPDSKKSQPPLAYLQSIREFGV